LSVRISFARNAARKQLINAGINIPPISVAKIAELNKLEIFEYSKLPDSISALIEPSKNVILINPSHNEVRKRFSIAHEIGHHVLGHFEDDSSEDNDGDEVQEEYLKIKHSADKETEANEFAAELLMPLRLVKNEYSKGKDPKALAKIFNVSEQAMWIRLSSLRLIKYH
jgi:Zn-dependent peptidase ImmA (M78 family)